MRRIEPRVVLSLLMIGAGILFLLKGALAQLYGAF